MTLYIFLFIGITICIAGMMMVYAANRKEEEARQGWNNMFSEKLAECDRKYAESCKRKKESEWRKRDIE